MQILELKIYTSKLNEQIDFYSKTLGLKVTMVSEKNAWIHIGKSILNLESSDKTTPYHFAINIPTNKIEEALQWLKKRVVILKSEENEIQNFDFWNAKAVYFYDKDKNIVEFIARKNLDYSTSEKFNPNHLIELSEIGLPTTDIKKTYEILHTFSGVDIFSGSFERICAIGDENGLFICIDKNEKKWFPNNDEAHSSAFKLRYSAGKKEYEMEYRNEEISYYTRPQ